ncbi:HAD-like domain-containing protein [Mycena belliarum]|uniref:Mitochondrial import inner membrane translocase subunit TIM50 n=1 Tax=Mycena belliarum TaxID=1033014 RepID=A0AAD6XGS3_9AGAR|nr:HAD-like domain-containing protein [Mycena belliae]
MLAAVARNVPRRALQPSRARGFAQLPNQNLPSLDFSPEVDQTTGAKSSKDSLSSVEQKRRTLGRISLLVLGLGFGINVLYLGREWDESELKAKKLTFETAPATRWGRTKDRFVDIFDYFNKPAWPELLPPALPPPHQKPYTLLISIDDLLVTSTWDRQHGWRTAKRPGVDYFLAYISQFYEVVVFTTQHFYTAAPILDKLDRYNFFIMHRLYREATRSINGKIVKDLSYLNRPLTNVVTLDTNPEHVSTHPENAIIIPPWKGDPNDKGLIAMIPFLESIGIYKPQDVRPILSAYQGKDIPLEYAKKEAEAKALHVERWTKNRPQGLAGASFSSWLGLSSENKPRGEVPLTYLEQKRREAQQQYQEEQKYIRDHKDYLESLLKKEQEMMAGEVPGTLWEAFDQMTGGPGKKKAPDAEPDTKTLEGGGSS